MASMYKHITVTHCFVLWKVREGTRSGCIHWSRGNCKKLTKHPDKCIGHHYKLYNPRVEKVVTKRREQ